MIRLTTFRPPPPPPATLPVRVAALMLKYWDPFQLAGAGHAANRRNLIAAITGRRPAVADATITALRRICALNYGTADFAELHTRALPRTDTCDGGTTNAAVAMRPASALECGGATRLSASRQEKRTEPLALQSSARSTASIIRTTDPAFFAALAGIRDPGFQGEAGKGKREAFATYAENHSLTGHWRLHWSAWVAASASKLPAPHPPIR